MDATTEQGVDLAELVLTDPTTFANRFAELLTGNEPHGEGYQSAAGMIDEHVGYGSETPQVGDITLKLEDSEGGGEGGGESVLRIYSVSKGYNNIIAYIKVTGCYYSHDGTYWDDTFTRVYPQRYVAVRYTEDKREDEV